MNATQVFDIDGVREIIFSYCLPEYPIVTKKMIDDRRDRLYWDTRLYSSEFSEYTKTTIKENKIIPPKWILMTNEYSNWVFPSKNLLTNVEYTELKKKEFIRKFYKNKFLCSLGIYPSSCQKNFLKIIRIANKLTRTRKWGRRAEYLDRKEEKIKKESKEAYEIYYRKHFPYDVDETTDSDYNVVYNEW